MIDDTGPRITALERRVAEIEARLLGMERVDAAIANNVLALEREAVRFADLSCVFNTHYADHQEVRFGQKVRALEAIEQARAARQAQPIPAANSSDTDRFEALAAMRADRDTWKARAEAGDRVLEQVLLWWRAEEELSMSDIVEKIRAHLQKGTP